MLAVILTPLFHFRQQTIDNITLRQSIEGTTAADLRSGYIDPSRLWPGTPQTLVFLGGVQLTIILQGA
jgi:hypothetical protein